MSYGSWHLDASLHYSLHLEQFQKAVLLKSESSDCKVPLPSWISFFSFGSRRRPIATVDELIAFIHTRSVFVAQTTLYGYLKTRMGTRYRQYFEDELFSKSIRAAAAKTATGCVSDLSIFAVALLCIDDRLTATDAREAASYCFRRACDQAFSAPDRDELPEDFQTNFDARASLTDWAHASIGENAFSRSPQDLVRYAPVIDDYKALDQDIVTNSIRFRWREIRDELRSRLAADDVRRDWQKDATSKRVTLA